MDGSQGANEAISLPTCQDSDGWLWRSWQVLAHGPLGRIESRTFLNVTVDPSHCWREHVNSGAEGQGPGEQAPLTVPFV